MALGLAAYYITGGWLERTAVANLEALASARQATLHAQLRDFRDGLINGLLEYSRIGRVPGSVGQVHVGTLLNSVVDSVNPLHYIAISVPSDTSDMEADELRLGQVFRI